MIKVIIKDFENEEEIKEMEVLKYYDCGSYYEFIFNDGTGFMPRERVIRIEE